MNPDSYDKIDLPFVEILSKDCEIIDQFQCYDMREAKIKMHRCLGRGKIARIVIKTVPWEDSIPF